MKKEESAIGIFDSGVGGLTVWKEIVKILPYENIIDYADCYNCPYGSKTQDEVIILTKKITDFLLKKNCKLIVVACNTATAASIDFLRTQYPEIIFVGMEPAVKPAALNTKTGNIGILATKGTFQGKLFKETSNKWANGKNMMIQSGDGLVELVEKGDFYSPEAEQLLEKYIAPMLQNHVDQIVLGCTHYPFFMKLLEKIVNGKAIIIDPAPAIAKRTKELLEKINLLNLNSKIPLYEFYINGNKSVIQKLLTEHNSKNSTIIEI